MANATIIKIFIFAFFLTFTRGAFFLDFSNPDISMWDLEVLKSFFVGLRFDFMVIGFCGFPFLIISFLGEKNRYFHLAQLFYWPVILILSSLIIAVDHQHYTMKFDRLSTSQWQSWPVPDFLNLALWLCVGVLFVIPMFFKRFNSAKREDLTNVRQNIKTHTALFILFCVMARGSFGPHHLDLRFSEISKNKFINHLAINSPYALDQALRDRR